MRKYLIGVIACGILVLLVLCYCIHNADRPNGDTVGHPVGVAKEMSTVPQKIYSRTDKENMPKLLKPSIREGTQTVRPVASRERVERTYTMKSTAYSLNENNTASGLRPGPGRVAVDPRIIPLGTRMWIEGYGECVAADTGSAIKGMRVDVWFADERVCMKWGKKPVKVVVYGK